jgi:hypothetical protein
MKNIKNFLLFIFMAIPVCLLPLSLLIMFLSFILILLDIFLTPDVEQIRIVMNYIMFGPIYIRLVQIGAIMNTLWALIMVILIIGLNDCYQEGKGKPTISWINKYLLIQRQ